MLYNASMSTIFITGTSRGIGKALAEKFLAEGHAVLGTSISGKSSVSHERFVLFPLDLSKPESIESCVSAVIEHLSKAGEKIDILVNNAGILADRGLTALDIPKLRTNLEVNLIGTADLTEHLIGSIDSDGHIVFISSAAGSISDMDHIDHSHAPYKYPGYKISKAAQNMYARTLAARLTRDQSNIIVSSVHPGWVRTEMGGEDATSSPEEAAAEIYKLATSRPETGQFWFRGERYPW